MQLSHTARRLTTTAASAVTTLRIGISTAVAVGLAAAVLAAPAPAAAAPPGDCPWPRVCIYNSSWVRTGAFQDITPDFQTILSAPRFAYNSRHDDVAYFRGTLNIGCVEPGRTADLRNLGTVTGIRISSESRCFA